MSEFRLPQRSGPKPRTTPWAPHIQLDQKAPEDMSAALAALVFGLPDVEERAGTVAHPRGAGDLAERRRASGNRGRIPRKPRDRSLPSLGRKPAHRPAARPRRSGGRRRMGRGPSRRPGGAGSDEPRDALWPPRPRRGRHVVRPHRRRRPLCGCASRPRRSPDWLKHLYQTESAATRSQP